MNCVVTYRKTDSDGRRFWANEYIDDVPSIEAAEAKAARLGIRGEGFEVAESRELTDAEARLFLAMFGR